MSFIFKYSLAFSKAARKGCLTQEIQKYQIFKFLMQAAINHKAYLKKCANYHIGTTI
jgi:hypothetical protein